MVDALMAVDAGSADMWRAAQLAVQIIGPRMIRASDLTTQLARFVGKDHAAMAAYILEHVDLALGVANHKQRCAKEIDGLDHAGARDVLAEADGCPVVAEQGVTLMGEHGAVNVTGVRKPICRFDGGHYVAQIDHGGYLMPELLLAGISHRKSVVATRLVHPTCERENG